MKRYSDPGVAAERFVAIVKREPGILMGDALRRLGYTRHVPRGYEGRKAEAVGRIVLHACERRREIVIVEDDEDRRRRRLYPHWGKLRF